jgi:hypothetical protein
MSTPIAMIASNGAVLAVEDFGFPADVVVGFVRSVIEVEERRSVADAKRAPPVEEDEDWICEEAYILQTILLAFRLQPVYSTGKICTSARQRVTRSSPVQSAQQRFHP